MEKKMNRIIKLFFREETEVIFNEMLRSGVCRKYVSAFIAVG